MIKLMQVKNILGSFIENTYLYLESDSQTFQNSLCWKTLDMQLKEVQPLIFELQNCIENNIEIEIDLFPIEYDGRLKEVAFMLLIVDKLNKQRIHQELLMEEDYNHFKDVLQFYIQKLGFFKKIYVRDSQMANRLNMLPNVVVDYSLDVMDNILQEELYGKK